jgi:hypothetical protein
MNTDMQPLPTARELHPEWTPEQARPEIGGPAYVIDELRSSGDQVAILTKLTGSWASGSALLEWFDPHHHAGPQTVGQWFRADHITSSREVARLGRRTLRTLGWSV